MLDRTTPLLLATWLALPPAGATAQQGAAPADAAQVLRELDAAYVAQSNRWYGALRAATGAEDEPARKRLMAERPEPVFLPQYVAAAERFAGSDGAVPFLVWITIRGGADAARTNWAIETLVRDHVGSDRLMPVTDIIGHVASKLGKDRARELLATIAEKNGNVEIAANALFTHAGLSLGTRGGDATDAQREQALADLRRARAMTKDQRLVEHIDSALGEEELLGVGKPAPDIDGEDLDGVAFRLSDYRGKVVLLSFWGDW